LLAKTPGGKKKLFTSGRQKNEGYISKKLLGFSLNKEKQEKSFFTKLEFVQGKWIINGVDKFK